MGEYSGLPGSLSKEFTPKSILKNVKTRAGGSISLREKKSINKALIAKQSESKMEVH